LRHRRVRSRSGLASRRGLGPGSQGAFERAGKFGVGAQLLERRSDGVGRALAPREVLELLAEVEEIGDRGNLGGEPIGPEVFELLDRDHRPGAPAGDLDRGADLAKQRVERVLVDGADAGRPGSAGSQVGDDDQMEGRFGRFHR
jgi:hypothetical protein